MEYPNHEGTYSVTAGKEPHQQLDFDDAAKAEAEYERASRWVRREPNP